MWFVNSFFLSPCDVLFSYFHLLIMNMTYGVLKEKNDCFYSYYLNRHSLHGGWGRSSLPLSHSSLPSLFFLPPDFISLHWDPPLIWCLCLVRISTLLGGSHMWLSTCLALYPHPEPLAHILHCAVARGAFNVHRGQLCYLFPPCGRPSLRSLWGWLFLLNYLFTISPPWTFYLEWIPSTPSQSLT